MRIGDLVRPSSACRLAVGTAVALGIAFASVPAFAQDGRGQSAIKAASRSDREFRAFYEARGNRPLWFGDASGVSGANALLDLISHAELDGIDPDAFDLDELVELRDRAEGGSLRALAKADLAFSRTFVHYAAASRRPRATGTVYLNPELTPRAPGTSALLRAAAAAPSLARYISSMGWMNPVYADLRDALGSAQAKRFGGAGPVVPAAATLRPGMQGAAVWALRGRLGLPTGGTYDRGVSAAVAQFQASRGMPVDGVAGPRTIAAMNEAQPDRIALIRTNLERARVLPTDPGRRYILVDAAGARMWMYEDGRVADTMKVIVGKASEPTPMLTGLMHYAIVNPYWNVPSDLARTRVAPGVLSKGVKYLKTMRYEVLSDWGEKPTVLDPKTIDWRAVAAGTAEVRVRQLPGKDNSMGRIKFVLPNDMGIYLHDTPDKHLFASADRHLSAGCVRVEDAQRLARWLFGKVPTPEGKAPEQRVELPEPVPVYLTYLTAAPAAKGLVYRADTYGRDRPGWAARNTRVADAR